MTLDASGVDTHGIDPDIYERRWRIHSVLCLCLVIVVIAVSSLNVAIPTIMRDLEASSTQMLWIVDAYALVFAGVLLPAGALGDRFGRKTALQFGIIVFGVMAVVAAFSGSANQLIGARAVMGIGAAFIMPATLSIITNVFPPHERAKAIAAWAGLSGAGGAIGPLLSGLILEIGWWWGAVFFINVPIAVVLFLLVTKVVPQSKDPNGHALDPIGAVLSIVMLGSLVFGIIEGPEYGWTSGHTVIAFSIAAIAGAAFVGWELKSKQPMLDPRLFKVRGFSIGSLTITVAFFCMFGTFYVISQYMQYVHGYSPLGAAVRMLPQAAVMLIVAPRSPQLVAKIGVHNNVRLGFGLIALGYLALTQLDIDTPYWFIALCIMTLAAGMAVMTAPTSAVIVGSLPLSKAGVGSAVNDVTREVGGTMGIAIMGSVLAAGYGSKVTEALAGAPIPEAALEGIKKSIGIAFSVADEGAAQSGPEAAAALRQAARESFVHGNKQAFFVAFLVAVVGGLIAGSLMPHSPKANAAAS